MKGVEYHEQTADIGWEEEGGWGGTIVCASRLLPAGQWTLLDLRLVMMGYGRTMRFGSTAKVLAECMLKCYRISEWDGCRCGSWLAGHAQIS